MQGNELKPANEGMRLIREWEQAEERLRLAERENTQARNNLEECKRSLGRWICPKDAKKEEPITLPVGDAFLVVTPCGYTADFYVQWRGNKRPTGEKFA